MNAATSAILLRSMDQLSPKDRKKYVAEVLRQISIQSGVIGGFSYTALTQVTFQGRHLWAEWIFGITSTITICLLTFAVFISGCLMFVSKGTDISASKWEAPRLLSWLSYSFGLAFFLISVALSTWVSGRDGKIITGIVVITIVACVGSLWWIAQKTRV